MVLEWNCKSNGVRLKGDSYNGVDLKESEMKKMLRKLGEMEQRFADLIWEKEPIRSGELVLLCDKEFSWKKSTTYTMLKRLCDDGIFSNKGSMVVAEIKKEDFLTLEGESLINKSFNGSLPQFLAAFTKRNKLSDKEIAEIKRLIDNHKEG